MSPYQAPDIEIVQSVCSELYRIQWGLRVHNHTIDSQEIAL